MGADLKLTEAEQSLLAALPKGDVADALRGAGLPGRRHEKWRWSDLRTVLRGPMALSGAYTSDLIPSPFVQNAGLVLTFTNGQLVEHSEQFPAGVKITTDAPHDLGLNSPVADLAASMVETPYTLCIEQNCAQPIFIHSLSDGSGLHQTRLQVHVAKGVTANIVEVHEGAGGYTVNNLSEWFLAEETNITRTIIQQDSHDAVTVCSNLVLLMADAHYHQTTLGFGGKLARVETRVQHGGTGSHATLNGVSLLTGSAHLDHTTHVDHTVAGCATEELYKSVVREKGRAVFQGKFYVARDAQQTDAIMAHNALLLSDTAEVYAKPELEIYADDVECAHGNTAGALDEEAIFYMRQRGLTEDEARGMLVEAFAGDVLAQITDEALREQLAALVKVFMEARV